MKRTALALFLGLFMVACSSSDDTSKLSSEDSVSDAPEGISIPMSDSHEDGRYFLTSQTTEDGIETIEYTRKGNTSDTYARMQINCSSNEMRKYSSENLESVHQADLGDWIVTPPDWTNEDIVKFICTQK